MKIRARWEGQSSCEEGHTRLAGSRASEIQIESVFYRERPVLSACLLAGVSALLAAFVGDAAVKSLIAEHAKGSRRTPRVWDHAKVSIGRRLLCPLAHEYNPSFWKIEDLTLPIG